ncbi:MAG: nuclear transport factor 2 family protein, partial [Actinomycetota bacterium]
LVPAGPHGAAVAEIEQLEDRRWEVQIAADVEGLAALLDDELSYTHTNSLVDTKSSYLDAVEKKVFDYRGENRSEVKTVVVGDTGLATGRIDIEVVAGGRELQLSARYSAVWARRDEGWRFLCWQSTPIPS